MLNTTIAQKNTVEEIALLLGGKKKKQTRALLFQYYGQERLGLNKTVLMDIESQVKNALPHWKSLITDSFLSSESRAAYTALLTDRLNRLNF